ncbi:MAG TPA: DUF1549 and DUF1553 domain-containing protein, partial [Pirellulales bacterium]|nr:DUF1549 and DUF1553 domain-containing protein [Pirellulales bacterium]
SIIVGLGVALLLSRPILVPAATPADASAPSAPSFRGDVMPVLFRAGCNAGTCHGSARGKDGFMLSLFGYDPKGDYFRITEEMVGRRVNLALPEKSLLLLKATGQVPHTGGRLFAADSSYYRTLASWIEAGAPDDAGPVPEPVEITLEPERMVFARAGIEQQAKVVARYSDGTSRDVTDLARYFSNSPSTATIDVAGRVAAGQRGDTFVFARFNRFTIGAEVIVLPDEAGYEWTNPPENNYIDHLVYERLQMLHLLPSELCDDETFLRRAYLDLAGTLPSVDAYRRFMADPDGDKRSRLVDELLAGDGFTDLWTGLWAESVRLMGSGYAPVATDVKAAQAYYDWIHAQIAGNRPLNEFVADQITATGSNLTEGPANLYTMLVHAPKFTPKTFAADFSQLLTGVRIQCAECHNHPFDRWTMDDYYGFVSLFTGVRRKSGSEPREFYIYNDGSAPPARHLLDDRPMPARVLGGEAPVPAGTDPRQALAAWLTSSSNELFARNLANRIWAHHMGRGLIEPLDDMRVSNPPTNKPLLDALAQHLVDSKFDLRALIREICTSRVYQLSTKPNATNAGDDRQFSRAGLRRLRADVLLDAITQATGVPRGLPQFPPGTKAVQFYPRSGSTEQPNAGDPFFATFGRSKRGSICACETKPEPTLSQVLHLMVGSTVQGEVGASSVVPNLLAAKAPSGEIIEELYIRTLSRRPSAEERSLMLELAGAEPANRRVYDDIFWSLLNSTEFMFNH